jgi:hypothetical protein
MADGSRRFPAPSRAEPIPGGYVVRDANGQAMVSLLAPGPDAAATLAAELRGDTPRDATGGCAGKLRGPIRWISDARTVKLE